MPTLLRIGLTIFAFVLLSVFHTSPSLVEIRNPGFESDCHLDGSAGHVCWEEPSGWQTYHKRRNTIIGLINPVGDHQFMNGNGATEGIQCLFVSVPPRGFGDGAVGLEQRLSTQIMPQTTYTLTVDVGNPKQWGNEYHYGFPGARIELFVFGEYHDELVTRVQNINVLNDGEWRTISVTFTVDSNSRYIGNSLGIRLINLNAKYGHPSLNEVLFDNVRLDATTSSIFLCIVLRIQFILSAVHIENINWSVFIPFALIPFMIGFLLIVVLPINLRGLYTQYGYKYEGQMEERVVSFCERPFYDWLYGFVNGAPHSRVYELNFQYNNIYECRVCLHEFVRNGEQEDILHCGHRFHKQCLRAWELQQLKQNPLKSYQCPLCRREYKWKQKWKDDIGRYVRIYYMHT